MYFDEHPPPHFHAEYGRAEAVVELATLGVIAGSLPPRAIGHSAQPIGMPRSSSAQKYGMMKAPPPLAAA